MGLDRTLAAQFARVGAYVVRRLRNSRRWVEERTLLMRPFSQRARQKLLFITLPERIAHSQIYPFHHYRAQLWRQFGIEMREASIDAYQADHRKSPAGATTVFLQTRFDISADAMKKLLGKIRAANPGARIVYLDWFAPTDLRLAEMLHGNIDLYVKKHVLRDRSAYARPTLGDTNLVDYYSRRFGLEEQQKHFRVPEGFLDRLVIGPSFATADYMLRAFMAQPKFNGDRPIDIHARLTVAGTAWYQRMRQECVSALQPFTDLRILLTPGVPMFEYLRELRASKLCFSPFGYGEVCWRDFEAIMTGAVLVKPDMSHVETRPDIFVPGETYVPVRWDLEDLEHQLRAYLSKPERCREMALTAFERLQTYFRSGAFLEQMRPLFDPARVIPPARPRARPIVGPAGVPVNR